MVTAELDSKHASSYESTSFDENQQHYAKQQFLQNTRMDLFS